MKLTILGATGGVGSEIVRQALERGHSVSAMARSPERLEAFAGRIDIIRGDLLNAEELTRAIDGQEAVLSAFGPRLPLAKADANLLERFASALTAAMQRAGVRQLAVVSTAFLFRDSLLPPAYLFGRLFFPTVVADAAAMERIIMQSGLDWTIVRPPQLTDQPRSPLQGGRGALRRRSRPRLNQQHGQAVLPVSGRYRVREGHLPVCGFRIARADVADFMLDVAEDPRWKQKIVGVSR